MPFFLAILCILAIISILATMAFFSSCFSASTRDPGSDTRHPRAVLRRRRGRSPPDHTHFNPAFNFSSTRYSNTEAGPEPRMQCAAASAALEDAQISPRTVPERLGGGMVDGEASLDELMAPQTETGVVGAGQEEEASVDLCPTSSARTSPVLPARAGGEQEGGTEDAVDSANNPEDQALMRSGMRWETVSFSRERRAALTGPEARRQIVESLGRRKETDMENRK